MRLSLSHSPALSPRTLCLYRPRRREIADARPIRKKRTRRNIFVHFSRCVALLVSSRSLARIPETRHIIATVPEKKKPLKVRTDLSIRTQTIALHHLAEIAIEEKRRVAFLGAPLSTLPRNKVQASSGRRNVNVTNNKKSDFLRGPICVTVDNQRAALGPPPPPPDDWIGRDDAGTAL